MILRLSGMQTTGKGKLSVKQKAQLERSCRFQILKDYVGIGDDEQRIVIEVCRQIREDQIPSHAELAGIGAFPVPANSVIVEFERLDDTLEVAGVWPDDFEGCWRLYGRFTLDGKRKG